MSTISHFDASCTPTLDPPPRRTFTNFVLTLGSVRTTTLPISEMGST
jgi:hypothetical protein